MQALLDADMNDGGVLGIKVDLFHASDRHACHKNLASRLEPADVGESCVEFVGGASDTYTCTRLYREPDDRGEAEENKHADRELDAGLLHTRGGLFDEAIPNCAKHCRKSFAQCNRPRR